MPGFAEIPNDTNGDVLRRMIQNGDDLTKSRMIDFHHVFPERRQALGFAEMVDDKELVVSISHRKTRDSWDVNVQRMMVPTHQDITAFELALAAKAELLGGEADGWGCMTCKTPS